MTNILKYKYLILEINSIFIKYIGGHGITRCTAEFARAQTIYVV